MKKSVLLVATVLTFGCASAFADDVPMKNWGGFYLGGNIGGVTESASGTSDFLDTGVGGPTSHANPQSNSSSNTRFIGGLTAGYNWQLASRFVAGIEADWDWSHTSYGFCRQTSVFSVACRDNGIGFESVSSMTDWLATVRARLGVTVANFLLYGTGGAALGRIETTLTQSCTVGGCGTSGVALTASSTSGTDKAGWVAGLGVESQVYGNWSAKAEWLHIDLGTVSNSLTSIGNSGTQTTTWSRTERFDVFRVGANYKFAALDFWR